MANGVSTFAADGSYNFYSPSASSNYFDTSLTASTDTSFGTAGFADAGAIVTPLSLVSLSVQYSSQPYIRMNTAGSVAAGGSTFYAPTNYRLNGLASYNGQGIGTSLSCSIYRFGKLTSGDTGYGFTCSASDGSLAVSQTYRTMYLHKTSSGAKLRTATAVTPTTPIAGNWSSQAGTYNQSLPQNITFDAPLATPPLIFITSSDGPISFNGMIRDGNGYFVGASISAASSIGTWSGYGSAATGNYSYGFTYFIVSHEIPTYGSSTHGVTVYNASGTPTFSSNYFVPSFAKVTIERPYFYLSGSYGSTAYTAASGSSISKSASQGVCINAFHTMTNLMTYIYFDYGGSGTGPTTIGGRYITVGANSVTCAGAPTASLFTAYGAITNLPDSRDAHRGVTTTMDVFFANYEY